MKNSLSGNYADVLFESSSPFPRGAIANSVIRVVREGLKGESEATVERAILQARREADILYLTVIEVNHRIQTQLSDSQREYRFLCACMITAIGRPLLPIQQEALRLVTSSFVGAILLLERTITRISTELCNGYPILFSDSDRKLSDQLALADQAMEDFNALARAAQFAELDKADIYNSLNPLIELQISASRLPSM